MDHRGQGLRPSGDDRDNRAVSGSIYQPVEEIAGHEGKVAGEDQHRPPVPRPPESSPTGCYGDNGTRAHRVLGHRGKGGMAGTDLDDRVGNREQEIGNATGGVLTVDQHGCLVDTHATAGSAG